jgi:SAM-dependent methyltransferase
MTNSLRGEIALAGPEHLDAAYVAGYDRKTLPRTWPSLRAHGLDANATLIDFGAGTGTLAVTAAAVCKRVVAVDVSPAMLDAILRGFKTRLMPQSGIRGSGRRVDHASVFAASRLIQNSLLSGRRTSSQR